MKTIITMISRVTIFLLLAGALYGQPQVEGLTPFILDNMTLVTENGERIVFQVDDYKDVIKKDIEIVREYDAERAPFAYRALEYKTFKVIFDLDFKVRNISITEPGPRLLNGIQIGEPLENFLKDFQKDSRYRTELYEQYSVLYVFFTEFKIDESVDFYLEPLITIKYNEDYKVIYIGFGYNWHGD